MANPQVENGHTDIANEIVEALAGIRISGEEWQILLVILRKTYGWHKKSDCISLSQFQILTKVKKPNIIRAINKLVEKNIIIKKDNGNVSNYTFNKDFTNWKPLSKKITHIIKKDNSKVINDNNLNGLDNSCVVINIDNGDNDVIKNDNGVINIDNGVIKNDNISLSKMIPTKESTTKETITKETITKETNIVGNSSDQIKTENDFKKKGKEKENIPYQEILDDLNSKIGSNYKSTTPKTRELIQARWNEGFRLDDFVTVHRKKIEEWQTDNNMRPYLRPITLYSNKFEGYLNQPERLRMSTLEAKNMAVYQRIVAEEEEKERRKIEND